MPVETGLYEILEISVSATTSEIKKAYRNKAKQHHPDKGGNAEEFKKVSGAYEILSDPKRKEIYDRYGLKGLKPQINSSSDLFSSLFGNIQDLFSIYKNVSNVLRKTKAINYRYCATLEEICLENVIKIKIIRKRLCSNASCSQGTKCSKCNGQGCYLIRKYINRMALDQKVICDECRGRCKKYSSCENCNEGVLQEEKTFAIPLNPEKDYSGGIPHVFEGEGNQDRDLLPGDLCITIANKQHSTFQYQHGHLHYKQKITLKESLCGHTLKIPHPNGETIVKEVPDVINPLLALQVASKGMSSKHDLYVQYEIEYPKVLSNDQKEILNEVL